MVAVDLDGALGDTRSLWQAWLAHAARRFARIAPLDAAQLPQDRVAAAHALDRWAEAGVGDWRRALERFAEDNAPVHLRPDPAANSAVRKLKRSGTEVVVVTDAPEELARVALAHLGLARSVDALEAGRSPLEGRDSLRVLRTGAELAAAAAA
ncbi:MAG: HAD family hydrolase [Thermoleophilia bacterium]|nr:HAD family hydrolase [Thermoleophilia bacterium]